MKFVIRAGGIGTRLWPFSRVRRPKQFHAMSGERTMVQDAFARLKPLAAPEDIYVSTGADLAGLVRDQLPGLAPDHLIVEPALRNTGPAVGLECALLEARHPGCTVASLGSDHHIGKEEEFRRLLEIAAAALERHPRYLFALGVAPTRVETGYGYICKGELLDEVAGVPIHTVARFTEKPGEEQARAYLDSGRYLWNTNMFAWKAATVLDLFSRFEPEIHQALMRIKAAAGSSAEEAVIAREYPRLRSIAVDHAILERAGHVATIEAEMAWGDIGSWAALTDVLPADEDGNLFAGEVLALDTRNVTAYGAGDKLVALVGVEDLVVVDTEDALLVCRKEEAQRVREVLERLQRREKFRRYL